MAVEMDEKIIRKLGIHETYFHDEIENDSSINASILLFKSRLNILAHVDAFNKAINLWKRTHPFLRSKVVHDPVRTHPQPTKYFALVSDDSDDTYLNNVKYLTLKRDGVAQPCHDLWKLLIEREVTMPIDWRNGPMWRLTIVNLNEPLDTNEPDPEFVYSFGLIVTITHAIFDGASMFNSVGGLFRIFEHLQANGNDSSAIEPHIVDGKVTRPVEICVGEFLTKSNIERSSLTDFLAVDAFKTPDYMVLEKAASEERTHFIPLKNVDILVAGVDDEPDDEETGHAAGFYDHNNKLVVKLSELNEISQKVTSKFHMTAFSDEKYKRFVAVCKANNVKVNGVLNTMFILAWRLAYKQLTAAEKKFELSASEILDDKINYATIINLRSFIKDVDPSSMIWFCTKLFSQFDEPFDLSSPDFWTSTFWSMARRESESFHARLKGGEQFKLFETIKPLDVGETRIHFGLSNVFVPSDRARPSSFKIGELYAFTSYRSDW